MREFDADSRSLEKQQIPNYSCPNMLFNIGLAETMQNRTSERKTMCLTAQIANKKIQHTEVARSIIHNFVAAIQTGLENIFEDVPKTSSNSQTRNASRR